MKKQPGTLRPSWPAEVRALTQSGAFLSPAGQKFVESHCVEVEQLPIGAGRIAELLWPLAPKGEPQCLWMVNTGEGVRRGFTGNRAWAKRRMAVVRAELGRSQRTNHE